MIFVLLCLLLFLVPSVLNEIIDISMAVAVFAAVGLLTYGTVTTLYTKRFSLFPVLALVAGVFAYASSVMCYTFGFFPLNFILGNRVKCSWGFFPRQASHGLFMLVFGLLIVLVAIRPLYISRERKHIEKVLEYVLLGLGVLQFLVGLFAIMDR